MNPSTQLDLGPYIVQLAQYFGSIILPVVVPYVVYLVRKYLHDKLNIDLNANDIKTIQSVADVGAQKAYLMLVQQAGHIGTIELNNPAVVAGAKYMLERIPGLLNKQGVSAEAAHAMVQARLGGLMAMDPTVGINGTVSK